VQHYSLYIVHTDQTDIANSIKIEILSQLNHLRCDPSILEIIENPKESTSDHLSKRISLGVFIGSKEGKNNVNCNNQINTLISAKIPVIPILVASNDFPDIAPESLIPINALHLKDVSSCVNIVSAILRLLGLTEKNRRVFISYSRKEASAIGEQLWEFLSKKGFEVFFDRFAIEPGVDFQEKLKESLCDKSFLLLLETPSAHLSRWVDIEVDFARVSNMGLLALTWPTTTKRFANIPEGYRTSLVEENFDTSGLLTENYLNSLFNQIESVHASSMLRRRRTLMTSLQKELERHGISYKLLSNWSLVADTTKGFSGHHLISITPRPPEVPDLFFLHKDCSAYHLDLERGVLLHTVSQATDEKDAVLKWVIAEKKLALCDEGQLVEMVKELEAGRI
jgi:hypothetical protein